MINIFHSKQKVFESDFLFPLLVAFVCICDTKRMEGLIIELSFFTNLRWNATIQRPVPRFQSNVNVSLFYISVGKTIVFLWCGMHGMTVACCDNSAFVAVFKIPSNASNASWWWCVCELPLPLRPGHGAINLENVSQWNKNKKWVVGTRSK